MGDRLLGVGSLCTLVAALAAVDDRVRSFLAGAVTDPSSSDLAMAAGRANHAAHAMLGEMSMQASEHSVIVLFGLASLGLLVLMFRT